MVSDRDVEVPYGSSNDYYSSAGATRPLDDLDREGEQSGDQAKSERQVRLPLGRALARPLEREVMRRERIGRLGHGAEILMAPDPLVVALAVQAGQHPAGVRNAAHQAQPRQQLE